MHFLKRGLPSGAVRLNSTAVSPLAVVLAQTTPDHKGGAVSLNSTAVFLLAAVFRALYNKMNLSVIFAENC